MIHALKKRLKSEKGFTLIELLAVIVILGILAAIAIPSINKIIQNSRVSAVQSDTIAVYNAAKLFASQHEDVNTFSGDNMQGTGTGTDADGNTKTYTSADSVLDNTSLKNISVTVNDDGSLSLTASGEAGSVDVVITGASYSQINNKDNWVVGTDGKIDIPKK